VLRIRHNLGDVGRFRISINLVFGIEHSTRLVTGASNNQISYELNTPIERQMDL